MIRWFARNDIAANFLLIGILLAGVWVAMNKVPLEVDPAWSFDDVFISIEYPGATAKDVESAIVIPIEEVLKDLPSVNSIRSDADRGNAFVRVEAKSKDGMRDLLDEIEARVARVRFPPEAEEPRIQIPDSNAWREVLTVAVMGNLEEEELRRAARRVRDDIMGLPGISQASIQNERPYEIAVEANQEKLRSFGIGFSDLSDAIRRSSVDMPAGSIQSTSGNLVVRTRGQAYTREDFAAIPIRAANGAEVLLGEVAEVTDGTGEERQIVRFNGEPAMMVEVMRHDQESAIEVSEKVNAYVAQSHTRFPEGIRLQVWDDESISIRGRLSTLTWSMVQGCVLVFLLLGLFLRPALAFWVVVGIPVSFAGGVIFMPYFGITANLMSVFGFIIVLGLVVDDAIVTGENIFAKLRTGMDPLEASVAGAKEVAVPVTFGVLTTVVAFLPLLDFPGHWGTLARQIPPVVAPVLLFSLIESKLILPSHLKHLKTGRTKFNPITRLQKWVADGLERFVLSVYQPTLKFAVAHRFTTIAIFFAMGLLMFGYCQSGKMSFVATPTVDRLRITAMLDLPTDTALERTDFYVKKIAASVEQLREEFTDGEGGPTLIKHIYTETGGDSYRSNDVDETEGYVSIEIVPPSVRKYPGPKNSEIGKRWKEIVGEIPEAYSFRMYGESRGHRGDREQEPMEIELRGDGSQKKVDLARAITEVLEAHEGIDDAWSDARDGASELEITLKPRAAELRLTQQALAQQVRQAFYGQEAQRVQRGRDEVRVMVRLTQAERRSLHTLDTLKIRTPDGNAVSLSSVANVQLVKAPRSIERIDGSEVIEVRANPVDDDVDLIGIAQSVTPEIQKLVNDSGEDYSFRFVGYVADYEESQRKTLVMSLMLLFALYALLAIPFKSLIQPLFVLLAVPFGIIGALLGHIIMDITPSYLSVFGILALAGVVVNDSLVMVDFINKRRDEGMPLMEAVLTAGVKRFRAILLTSLTTFVGLMPLMFERSIQAQFLIPMAVSLGFGILFATGITLYLIPSAYLIAEDLKRLVVGAKNWYVRPFRDAEAQPQE